MSELQDWMDRSQLFVVRVWLEKISDGKSEWRGRVLHVSSSETCYFRDWQSLTGHMCTMLAGATIGRKGAEH